MYDHAYVCGECEGTARWLEDGEPTEEECPDCFIGLIGADADDCEENKCDLCMDPRLEDTPELLYGRSR